MLPFISPFRIYAYLLYFQRDIQSLSEDFYSLFKSSLFQEVQFEERKNKFSNCIGANACLFTHLVGLITMYSHSRV